MALTFCPSVSSVCICSRLLACSRPVFMQCRRLDPGPWHARQALSHISCCPSPHVTFSLTYVLTDGYTVVMHLLFWWNLLFFCRLVGRADRSPSPVSAWPSPQCHTYGSLAALLQALVHSCHFSVRSTHIISNQHGSLG